MKKILLISLISVPLFAVAQKHHEAGIVLGVSGYRGDLNPTFAPHEKMIRPTIGIMYKHFFNPHLGIRANFNYIPITAADSLSNVTADKARNLSFGNNMLELQTGLELNLLPIEADRFKFTPYIFAGVAAIYTNPYAHDVNNKKVFLRELSTEGQGVPGYSDRRVYSTLATSFPLGFGVKGFVGKTVMVTGEVGLRYANTDYLDDVSRRYVNLDSLMTYKGPRSVEMSFRGDELNSWDGLYPTDNFQRGDYLSNDWYWSATIGFTVYFRAFGNAREWANSKCPRVFGRRF